jgi:hypothetical protein
MACAQNREVTGAAGSSGNGEVAALVSLFFFWRVLGSRANKMADVIENYSELHERTKWRVLLNIIPSLNSERWPDYHKQEQWVRARFMAS